MISPGESAAITIDAGVANTINHANHLQRTLCTRPSGNRSSNSHRHYASDLLQMASPRLTTRCTCTPSPSLPTGRRRSEEHTSELQSHSDLVCRLLLEKKKTKANQYTTVKKKTTPTTQ